MMKQIIVLIIIFINVHIYGQNNKTELYGEIVYQSDGSVQAYILNRYDNRKKISRKEFYSPNGYIQKYITFKYNDEGHLISEKTFNTKNVVVKSVSNSYKNGTLKKRVVEISGRKYYVYYDHAYFDNKLLYILESYYNNDHHDDESFFLKKKSTYAYKGNETIILNYILNPKSEINDFDFTSGEIQKQYRGGKLWKITYLNQYRQEKASKEYVYDNTFETGNDKIKKIKLYKIKKRDYNENSLNKKKKTLVKFITFEYNTEPFKNLKGFEGDNSGSNPDKKLTYYEAPKKENDKKLFNSLEEVNEAITFLESELEKFNQKKTETSGKDELKEINDNITFLESEITGFKARRKELEKQP